jgi:hypothetical protein
MAAFHVDRLYWRRLRAATEWLRSESEGLSPTRRAIRQPKVANRLADTHFPSFPKVAGPLSLAANPQVERMIGDADPYRPVSQKRE